jgi:glutathione S-transferase
MLTLWELAPSPNNLKVRLALRFKGIEFEVVPVDARDRAPVLELSGQELTPVVEDRGIVLNDSEAILQYLDANYRRTPRLMPAEREGRRACEAFKAVLDERLARHWAPIFFHVLGVGEPPEPAVRQQFEDGLRWLETEIRQDGTFCGRERPICDLRVATWALYALPGDGILGRVPLFARFADAFAAPANDLPRLTAFLRAWDEHAG